MTREEIFAKVVEIVRPFAKDKEALDNAKDDTNILDDLMVNSARLVDEDADSVNTIGDAVNLIEAKLA